MQRRYFIIGAIAVVVLGLLIAAYFLFFAGSPSVVVVPPGGGFPSAGSASGGAPGVTATSSVVTPVTASTTIKRVPLALPSGKAPAKGAGLINKIQPSSTAGSAAAMPVPGLVEIDAGPVVPGEVGVDVSYATLDAPNTPINDVAVEYIHRESGNTFLYLFAANYLVRMSNRTIPGIEEADWLPDGSVAFIRYLSGDSNATINTYALLADGTDGYFLPQNLSGLSLSATALLTLASGANGSVATVESFDGSGASEAFSTPLSSLRAYPLGASQYLAYTKPSSSLPGYAFTVSKGLFSRIAGPLPGLVALPSPSGASILVSYSESGVLHMELVDVKTRAELPLPIATIADKCTWAADESAIYCGVPTAPPATYSYPDDWYQGAVHFNDRIWKIDVAGRFATLVLDFAADTSTALDATNLAIDPTGSILVFRNKNDASLWAYQL